MSRAWCCLFFTILLLAARSGAALDPGRSLTEPIQLWHGRAHWCHSVSPCVCVLATQRVTTSTTHPSIHPPTSTLWLHLSCGAPGPACLVLPLPLHGATGLLVVLRRPRRRYVSSPRLLKGGGGRAARAEEGGSAMHSCISSSQTQPIRFLYPSAPAACGTFKVRPGFWFGFVLFWESFRSEQRDGGAHGVRSRGALGWCSSDDRFVAWMRSAKFTLWVLVTPSF